MERAEYFDDALEYLLEFEIVPSELVPAAASVGAGLALGIDPVVKGSSKWWVNGYIIDQIYVEEKEFWDSIVDNPDLHLKAMKETWQFQKEVQLVLAYLTEDGAINSYSRKKGWHTITRLNDIRHELHKIGLEWVRETHIIEAKNTLSKNKPS